MFEIWDKAKISNLTTQEKDQWYDVLNYELEQDRGISLNDPDLSHKQQIIKDDYFNYIESCPNNDSFYKYYIYKDNNKIISVCRINIYNDEYILEGLQTHRDYYRKNYASKLILGMMESLKKDGIKVLYSEARVWNTTSNALQTKLGFIKYGQNGINNLYKINL
ncbi:MAG: GNAT family N-acetyltransferase [Acholeplasmataceae bacterium]